MKDSPFAVVCESVIIGHSAFEQRGLPRGVLRGSFEPTAAYAPVRRLFQADALARAQPEDPDSETLLRAHYRARDQLHFEIIDKAGVPIPIEYLHVYEPVRSGHTHQVVARLAVPGESRQRKGSRWRGSRPDI
jgi:hypothetical protein